MDRQTPPTRGGFTAIELLAVIAIIGILAGIAVPAVMSALNNVKRGTLKSEADALAGAIEKYRDKYGDYPPDGSDWEVFKRHCQKAFPQILASELDLLDPTVGDTLPNDSRQYNFSGDYAKGGPAVRNSSDTAVTEAQNFAPNELKVMDPAEALVFFLGGFSSDPRRPFTGPGGPFAILHEDEDEIHLGYNTTRQNPLYDFNVGQLTLSTYTAPDGDVVSCSNDERYGQLDAQNAYLKLSVPTNTGNDLLPVYLPKGGEIETDAPYVYFDSRTYFSNKKGGPYINFYQPMNVQLRVDSDLAAFGAVYPMYSDTPNTTRKSLPGIPFASAQPPASYFLAYQMMEPTKFQVIGPGLDGKYGGRVVAEIREASDQVLAAQQTLIRFPSGESINQTGTKTRGFRVPLTLNQAAESVPTTMISRMTDNVANFSGRTFEAGSE